MPSEFSKTKTTLSTLSAMRSRERKSNSTNARDVPFDWNLYPPSSMGPFSTGEHFDVYIVIKRLDDHDVTL